MKLKIVSSKLLKPFHEGTPPPLPTPHCIPLTVFDQVTYDLHIAIIYAYRPPTPPNATVELGLRKALSVYREWAGRLGGENENAVILLNDEGVRFVEASVDRPLNQTVNFRPSSSLLSLHPALAGVPELMQVQLTRFSCGSLVVGFTAHHRVADGHATSDFLVAWGQACRGVEISPTPFHDRTIFSPRDPPLFEFEHRGVEYISKNFKKAYPLIDDNIEVHKVHYTAEFLSKLKAKASPNTAKRPFSTFESLLAHLWRAITKARTGLNEHETTQVRMSVDGRARLNPKLPNEYFGNLVLWAFAKARVSDLVSQPISFAAKVLHEAVMNVNDNYFKSFIDFANHKAKEEDLVPTAVADTVLWPDLEVDSWIRFPFYDLDLGGGCPYIFMPSFFPTEGMIFLVPSFFRDGSIDVFVPLFTENLATFKHICYSLD